MPDNIFQVGDVVERINLSASNIRIGHVTRVRGVRSNSLNCTEIQIEGSTVWFLARNFRLVTAVPIPDTMATWVTTTTFNETINPNIQNELEELRYHGARIPEGRILYGNAARTPLPPLEVRVGDVIRVVGNSAHATTSLMGHTYTIVNIVSNPHEEIEYWICDHGTDWFLYREDFEVIVAVPPSKGKNKPERTSNLTSFKKFVESQVHDGK